MPGLWVSGFYKHWLTNKKNNNTPIGEHKMKEFEQMEKVQIWILHHQKVNRSSFSDSQGRMSL